MALAVVLGATVRTRVISDSRRRRVGVRARCSASRSAPTPSSRTTRSGPGSGRSSSGGITSSSPGCCPAAGRRQQIRGQPECRAGGHSSCRVIGGSAPLRRPPRRSRRPGGRNARAASTAPPSARRRPQRGRWSDRPGVAVVDLAVRVLAHGAFDVDPAASVPAHPEGDLRLGARAALAVGVEDLREAGGRDAPEPDPLGGRDHLAGVQRIGGVVVEMGHQQVRLREDDDGQVPAHLRTVEGGLGPHQVRDRTGAAQ